MLTSRIPGDAAGQARLQPASPQPRKAGAGKAGVWEDEDDQVLIKKPRKQLSGALALFSPTCSCPNLTSRILLWMGPWGASPGPRHLACPTACGAFGLCHSCHTQQQSAAQTVPRCTNLRGWAMATPNRFSKQKRVEPLKIISRGLRTCSHARPCSYKGSRNTTVWS